MAVSITDTFNVADRAVALGISPLGDLTVLPRNFETAVARADLLHESSTATIRKLWRERGVDEKTLERAGETFPHISERYADWIAPTLFVTAKLLSENGPLVSLAIETIKEYVLELFRGSGSSNRTVKLDIVVEETQAKRYRKLSYSGPAEGLSTLPKILKESIKTDGN